MDETIDEDKVAEFCTCGRQGNFNNGGSPNHDNDDIRLSSTGHPSSNNSSSSGPKSPPSWLESSFVHLLAPLKSTPSKSGSNFAHNNNTNNNHHHNQHQQHGFLEAHNHLLQLMEATLPTSDVSICLDCIDRVSNALEADTQRLYNETKVYRDAIEHSKHKEKIMTSRVGQAYQDEIDLLTQEVNAKESELLSLRALYKEQVEITQQLDQLEGQLQQDQNTLELEARAFDNSIQLVTRSLLEVQTEVDRLSVVKLPHALFDLQVDQRGLRYPLINQLRLAYRPKGDVPLKEVQVAWSQATQLLLILGTLLEYKSSDWKLVPLADCAKLIFRREIYNLSPGDCRSLIAWNALLDQVIRHAVAQNDKLVSSSSQNSKPVPFPSSSTTIGSTDLTRLDRQDNVRWSRVIHCMASNLLWLSDFAAAKVANQIGVVTHSVA